MKQLRLTWLGYVDGELPSRLLRSQPLSTLDTTVLAFALADGLHVAAGVRHVVLPSGQPPTGTMLTCTVQCRVHQSSLAPPLHCDSKQLVRYHLLHPLQSRWVRP